MKKLKRGRATSSWGAGTNLITSKNNPAFGGVYKLAAIRTADGSVYEKKTGKIKADLICLYDETFDESEDLKL